MMVRKSGSKRVTATVMGLMVACGLIFAAPSAFASEALKWNSCKETLGTGGFEDAACSKALSGGNFSWSALPEKTAFVSEGLTQRIKTVQSGVVMEITCNSATGKGQLDNGGAGAVVQGYVLTYQGCGVTAPSGKGCKIQWGAIPFTPMAAGLTSPTSQEMSFASETGETLAEWYVEGCSLKALNHSFTMKGKFGGVVNNGSSSLGVTRASSQSNLSVMGQAAWIEGSSDIETGSGEALKLGL